MSKLNLTHKKSDLNSEMSGNDVATCQYQGFGVKIKKKISSFNWISSFLLNINVIVTLREG